MPGTPAVPVDVDALRSETDDLVTSALADIAGAVDVATLDSIDQERLGKRSRLGELKAALRDLDPADRKVAGRALHEARHTVETAVAGRRVVLEAAEQDARLAEESIDLTELRGGGPIGHHHLISQTRRQLEDIFVGLGFTVEEGPEIETDWYNFQALNTPPEHPARSMWDTLYLDVGEPETVLLRTHTSPVQIRTMMTTPPPIYMVAPGRVFRRDTADATHLPMFNQIEGLVVDRDVSFPDLAGTIERFVKAIFGDDRTTRLRPSYFPFTEPSAEFDISTGDGGWVELGGCGLVHPNVLRSCGIDPEEWSGFAFGFGMDRISMQRHGLDDLREFVTNDIRFLSQF